MKKKNAAINKGRQRCTLGKIKKNGEQVMLLHKWVAR